MQNRSVVGERQVLPAWSVRQCAQPSAGSVAEALEILDRESVSGAILDANLVDRDVTPVGLVLAERGVPFIVHSALGLPTDLERAVPAIRLVPKPAPSYVVIAHLLATMAGD